MRHTVFDRITRGIEIVLAAAFIAAVCLNFANVLGRYLFGVTFGWADEVQVFVMVWMAFLGAVVVSWRGAHLRMDLLLRMLPAPLQTLVRVFELLVLITAAGFVVSQSYKYAATMLQLGRASDVGGIPMWIPHSGVAIGFALIAMIALVQLWDLAVERRA
jgi:TRAP-type C4-dicarboxylate transport system permease small subunit